MDFFKTLNMQHHRRIFFVSFHLLALKSSTFILEPTLISLMRKLATKLAFSTFWSSLVYGQQMAVLGCWYLSFMVYIPLFQVFLSPRLISFQIPLGVCLRQSWILLTLYLLVFLVVVLEILTSNWGIVSTDWITRAWRGVVWWFCLGRSSRQFGSQLMRLPPET